MSVDGVDATPITEYIFANATTVQFLTAPAADTVRIYRVTSNEDIQSVFYPGSAIRARDLNDNFAQALYVVQEGCPLLVMQLPADAAAAAASADAAAASAETAGSRRCSGWCRCLYRRLQRLTQAQGDASIAVNTSQGAQRHR